MWRMHETLVIIIICFYDLGLHIIVNIHRNNTFGVATVVRQFRNHNPSYPIPSHPNPSSKDALLVVNKPPFPSHLKSPLPMNHEFTSPANPAASIARRISQIPSFRCCVRAVDVALGTAGRAGMLIGADTLKRDPRSASTGFGRRGCCGVEGKAAGLSMEVARLADWRA
jgi:hypothetical protein